MQNFTFNHRHDDSKVDAKLTIWPTGTVVNLEINLSGNDDEQGALKQTIGIDVVLDNQFHVQVSGLDDEQAMEFASALLANGHLTKVEQHNTYRSGQDGKVVKSSNIDVAGQPFESVFQCLLAAMPVLAPLIDDLKLIDNPVWQAAWHQKDPFFGSANQKPVNFGGQSCVQYSFEKVSLLVSNDGNNPVHYLFIHDKDKAIPFANFYPANAGGGIMHVIDGRTYFQFGGMRSARLNGGSELDLDNTVNMLLRAQLLSPAEAEKFVTHQSILGNGSRKLQLSAVAAHLRNQNQM